MYAEVNKCTYIFSASVVESHNGGYVESTTGPSSKSKFTATRIKVSCASSRETRYVNLPITRPSIQRFVVATLSDSMNRSSSFAFGRPCGDHCADGWRDRGSVLDRPIIGDVGVLESAIEWDGERCGDGGRRAKGDGRREEDAGEGEAGEESASVPMSISSSTPFRNPSADELIVDEKWSASNARGC